MFSSLPGYKYSITLYVIDLYAFRGARGSVYYVLGGKARGFDFVFDVPWEVCHSALHFPSCPVHLFFTKLLHKTGQ